VEKKKGKRERSAVHIFENKKRGGGGGIDTSRVCLRANRVQKERETTKRRQRFAATTSRGKKKKGKGGLWEKDLDSLTGSSEREKGKNAYFVLSYLNTWIKGSRYKGEKETILCA